MHFDTNLLKFRGNFHESSRISIGKLFRIIVISAKPHPNFLYNFLSVITHVKNVKMTYLGRLLHLLPGKMKYEAKEEETDSFKKKKEQERKANAGSSHNWNSLFMNVSFISRIFLLIISKIFASEEFFEMVIVGFSAE